MKWMERVYTCRFLCKNITHQQFQDLCGGNAVTLESNGTLSSGGLDFVLGTRDCIALRSRLAKNIGGQTKILGRKVVTDEGMGVSQLSEARARTAPEVTLRRLRLCCIVRKLTGITRDTLGTGCL